MFNKPIIGYEALSQKDCRNVINFSLNHSEKSTGKIGGSKDAESGVIDLDIRNVTTYSPPENMSEDQLIERGFNLRNIFASVWESNEKFFHFEIDGAPEFHVLKYEVGCHYGIHSDVGIFGDDKMKLDTRKLSFSIFLNNDYKGGDLVFSGISPKEYIKPDTPCKAGDMIVFPSYLYHEVEPVTSGVRWVGVGWLHGKKPFK